MGELYCVGGMRTGQTCGWKVGRFFETAPFGGSTEKVRNVWEGSKTGECVARGDSGGPVYTIRQDGYIVGKGITSFTNYEDPTSATWIAPCRHGFTDLYDVALAMGGDIKKRKVS
jgi:hypothetical protein